MLTDRYGLPLSPGAGAGRDAYVEAADLALTFYPGAAEAYDRAIAADPGFAMAHAGKAQMLAREGDVPAARAALAAAKGFVSGLSEREASHIAFFDLTFAGRTDDAIAALYPHLTAWPRDGFFHGHLSWHFSLCEIQAGNWERASHLYRDGIALDRHSGGPQNKMSDAAAFLWRSELAGYPRDIAAWRGLYDYGSTALPRSGSGLADLHVILTQVVMGDDAGLTARAGQMEEMARAGRYPSGSYLPTLAPGFAAFERGDFAGAIDALAPLAGQHECIGGSRAQHDL